jgi:hypothetical protein
MSPITILNFMFLVCWRYGSEVFGYQATLAASNGFHTFWSLLWHWARNITNFSVLCACVRASPKSLLTKFDRTLFWARFLASQTMHLINDKWETKSVLVMDIWLQALCVSFHDPLLSNGTVRLVFFYSRNAPDLVIMLVKTELNVRCVFSFISPVPINVTLRFASEASAVGTVSSLVFERK